MSKRASKRLFWIWHERDLSKSVEFERGADVACGSMKMRPHFRTKTYHGIDIDEERLRTGKSKYPEVTAECCSIEEIDHRAGFDFVTCVETIGINNKFDPETTGKCIDALVGSVAKGGTLLLNIGPNCASYMENVERSLRTSFARVTRKNYGAFQQPVHSDLSRVLARLMFWFPPLRHGKQKFAYFKCEAKR